MIPSGNILWSTNKDLRINGQQQWHKGENDSLKLPETMKTWIFSHFPFTDNGCLIAWLTVQKAAKITDLLEWIHYSSPITVSFR